MKIILENRMELEELKDASRFIHDNIHFGMDIPMVNLISHLYLNEKDTPGIGDILVIKEEKDLKGLVEELYEKNKS